MKKEIQELKDQITVLSKIIGDNISAFAKLRTEVKQLKTEVKKLKKKDEPDFDEW